MKNYIITLVLSLFTLSVCSQSEHLNKIDKLYQTHPSTFEVFTEKTYEITDKIDLYLKNYIDITNGKTFKSIEINQIVFEKEELSNLLSFFKKCVEYKNNSSVKNISVNYISVGMPTITFAKVSGSGGAMSVRSNMNLHIEMFMDSDIEKIYNILKEI